MNKTRGNQMKEKCQNDKMSCPTCKWYVLTKVPWPIGECIKHAPKIRVFSEVSGIDRCDDHEINENSKRDEGRTMKKVKEIKPECETCQYRKNITNERGKKPVGKCSRTKDWSLCYENDWCSDYEPTLESKLKIIHENSESDTNEINPLQNYWIIGYDVKDSSKKTRVIPLSSIKQIYIPDANEVTPEYPRYRKAILAQTNDREMPYITLFEDADPEKVQAHFMQIIEEISRVLAINRRR